MNDRARPDDRYHAFISYSHAADGRLAPAIQRAVTRFGRPWYAPSPVRVFRDETGLALTPDLWGEIEQRLGQSECFILLASPAAARSEWVEKEVRFWLEHRAADRLFVVLTHGEMNWALEKDGSAGESSVIPAPLRGVENEPLWADLRWAKTSAELSLGNPRFHVEVARLVAGMRGVPLEAVFDQDAAQQRRARLWSRAAIAALAAVTILALAIASVSVQAKRTADQLAAEANRRQQDLENAQRSETEQQDRADASIRLATTADSVFATNRELGTLLALQAVSLSPTPEAERALRKTLLGPSTPLVLRGHSGLVYAAELSRDGRRVLTSSTDGTVREYDAVTGEPALTWRLESPGGFDVASGAFSPDGSRVLTMLRPSMLGVGFWENPGPVELRDAATGAVLTSIVESGAVDAAVSPDNTQIVTGGFDTSVKVWNARTGKLAFPLEGHVGRVSAVAFSPDGNSILSGSWDGTTRVWDAHSGQSRAVLPTQEVLEAAVFSPDGQKILTLCSESSGQGKYLSIWDWVHSPGGSAATFSGHQGIIFDFEFSSDGRLLATASADQTARIWDTATGRCLHVLSGHPDAVIDVAFSPNAKWIATVSNDAHARVWEASTGEPFMEIGDGRSQPSSVEFAADSKRIVLGTVEGEALIYPCEVCGSIDDLVTLAHSRVRRALTDEERRRYLPAATTRATDANR